MLGRLLHSLRSFCLLFSLFGLLSISNNSAAYAAEKMNSYELSIKPSVCISYDLDSPCNIALEISWESANAADICLREETTEPYIHCWEDSTQGSIDYEFADTSDTTFQLIDEASEGVVADSEIKIISRDLRNSRRRRRHVWSLI